MSWSRQNGRTIRNVVALLSIGCGLFIAYWWFYKLSPVRRLADPEWQARHSAKARWEEEQKKYHRLSASPDLCFAGDRIGFYGNSRWCLWLINKIESAGSFRVCGCTETALMMMANRHEQDWNEWGDAHGHELQEEWIRDGFAQHQISVHLPPLPEDSVPLLEVLGHKTWHTLWNGPQKDKEPDAFPRYLQYNAFRWLRDSDFDPVTFASSNPSALDSDLVKVGLLQYSKWNSAFPKKAGVGILAFGNSSDEDKDLFGTPSFVQPWFQIAAWLFILLPILGGVAMLYWKRRSKIKPGDGQSQS